MLNANMNCSDEGNKAHKFYSIDVLASLVYKLQRLSVCLPPSPLSGAIKISIAQLMTAQNHNMKYYLILTLLQVVF